MATPVYFGIRHHGPGCARALRSALQELDPDLLLIEGPVEAEPLLSWAGHADMKPPVALLIYDSAKPSSSIFYPVAEYSPEWQALRFAHPRQVPVRLIDMPAAVTLALQQEAEELAKGAAEALVAALEEGESPEEGKAPAVGTAVAGAEPEEADEAAEVEAAEDAKAAEPEADSGFFQDGFELLAEAAGFDDHELWWEHEIERRGGNSLELFEGIREAMTALRAEAPPAAGREAQREAYMRRAVRTAVQDGYQRIAVICGAWHVPALLEKVSAKADQETIREVQQRLPRLKVEVAWVPWTNQRLSWRSGYGAGVEAPGWYQHLWISPEQASIRWLAESARLLRDEDLDAPPASVIEAVRLAESLASLRDLRAPGLAELREATRSVLCHGHGEPIALIRERLEIGRGLGAVPAEAPALPVQRDFEAQVKALRLKKSDGIVELDLDLRKDLDLQRSKFLHRLLVLQVPWSTRPPVSGGKSGTFHEFWTLLWKPEIEVSLIEASLWGQTIVAAAAGSLAAKAREANLAQLTGLLDQAILADLSAATESLLEAVEAQAVAAADLDMLMKALPPLARVARYGSVRGVQSLRLEPILQGIFERSLVGLLPACGSLDDAAAALRLASLQQVEEAIGILDRQDWREELLGVWDRLKDVDSIHGLLRGYACRALLEGGVLDTEKLETLAALALSPILPPAAATAWVEGLLRGSAVLVLHQDGLWRALDTWLAQLDADTFRELLPLLRRAFAQFEKPARRTMGEKVKTLRNAAPAGRSTVEVGLDLERANQVLPILATLLGAPKHG